MKTKLTARLQQLSVASIVTVMLLNMNAWTVNFFVDAVFGSAAYASEENDELLKKLRDKHRLDDPYRHKRGEQRYEVINRSSRDLTEDLEKGIISARSRDGEIDFARFDLQSLTINDGLDSARVVASTAANPSMSEDGQIQMSVASEPVLRMFRDEETGELRYEQVENAHSIQRKQVEIGRTEIFSTEIEHENTAWEGENTYGNEESFFQAGRDSNQRLSSNTTQTGESEAYKTIMSTVDRGANETIPETILQPGFDYLEDAIGEGGDMFSGCSTVTQTENVGLYTPDIRERYCQEMNSDNPFFCEIRREIDTEGFISSSNYSNCGVGCFQYNHLTVETNTSRSCRSTWYDQNPNITAQNSNLRVLIDKATEGAITLESVRVRATYTHDHFMVTMNGEELWYNIGTNTQIASNSPAMRNGLPWFDSFFKATGGGGNCNISSHTFDTPWIDVTARALEIIEQTGNFEGIQDLSFQTDFAYSSYGQMNIDIQLQFSDELAIVEEKVTQYPEGCLDTARYTGDTSEQPPGNSGGGGGDQTCKLEYVCPAERSWTLPLSDQICIGQLIWEDPDSTAVDRACLYNSTSCSANFESDRQTTQTCSTPPGGSTGGFPDNDGWCTFTDYEIIDQGRRNLPDSILNQLGPLFPGDTGNASWRVNLTDYTCDPFQGGEFCVEVATDVPGEYEEVCQTWEEIQAGGGTCGIYENDSSCKEVARECVEGWESEDWDNYCFNETVTYECDEGRDLSFSYETTKNTCDSMLPCIGGDCDWGEEEGNDRFLEAVAMGNVAEHIQGNQSCEDPNDPTTCRIFEGERGYCSWALASDWGSNCCDAPDGISFLTYLQASMALMRFENKQLGGVFTEPAKNAISGAWKTVAEPVNKLTGNAWSKMTSAISSKVESLVGNTQTTLVQNGVEQSVAEAGMGPVMSAISQYIYDALPEAFGDLIFATMEQEGVTQVVGLSEGMQAAVDFMSSVMFWYSMYQLAQLLTDLYFACDDVDNDTSLKMAMKQCYSEGDKYCSKELLGVCTQRRQDHCCYPSMLARIIMEQAQHILDKDMSECNGLTHEELAVLDFSQIDFSEWIGTLIENDMMPSNTEDDLTGSGRMVNNEGRETVSERTKKRTEGMSEAADLIKEELREPLDCSKYPRPPICEFQITLGEGK